MAKRAKARKPAKKPLITQVRIETPRVKKDVFMSNWAEMKAFGRSLGQAPLPRKASDKADKEAPERDESSKDKKETKSKSKSKTKKKGGNVETQA